jgi:membrane protease YdiL (CAAX protease family)
MEEPTRMIAKILDSRNKLTFVAFCLLFLIRLTDFFGANFAGDYAPIIAYYYVLITTILITVIVGLNKEQLSDLHIDKYFIYVFLILDILNFMLYGVTWLGIIGCTSALYIVYLIRKRKFNFENDKKLTSLVLMSMLGVAPVLLLRLLANEPSLFIKNLFLLNGITIFGQIFITLHSVIYEELLFRGLLWMYLEKLKLSGLKILFVQALLFWIVHLNSTSRAFFWVLLPLLGLWFGFLVLRSKSLIPSISTHFVYNFIVYLS